MTFTIDLPEDQVEHLQERARLQNQTLEALVETMISDLLTEHRGSVQEETAYILQTDRELLLRLA